MPNIIPCHVCGAKSVKFVAIRFDSHNIVKCVSCGHIFLNPPLDNEILSNIYNGYHVTSNEERWMEIVDTWFRDPKGPYQRALAEIDSLCGFSGKQVIDIGCGSGRFLYECRKRGAVVTGVDSAPGAAYLAKKYFDLDLISMPLEQATQGNIISKSAFDILVAFEVIEHVPDIIKFLSTANSILKPNGVAIITCPNFYLFYSMGKATPDIRTHQEHISFFTPSTLEMCMKKSGFKNLRIFTISPIPYGHRIKLMLANNKAIKKIWQKINPNHLVKNLKNILVKSMNKCKTNHDRKGWTGQTIICIAKKNLNVL